MSSDTKFIHFLLVTPDGVRYDDMASSVSIPTEQGEVTILPNHSLFISKLKSGKITIVKSDGTTSVLSISHGLLEVRSNNTLYVLADSAEHAADIDIARAEAARKRAEELLASAELDNQMEYARIQAQIEKELARISVGNKYKDVK